MLIWSTSFVSTKIAFASFPPLTLGAARFAIASLVLGVVLVSKKEFIKPTVKDLGIMSVSGILGITLYFAMENIGVSLTSASNAALIVASYPAITALLELIIYRVKISWLKGIGIALAIIGVYQLSYTGQGSAEGGQVTGNIILIVTGVVWALYNFVTRKVVNKYPAITVSFYQTIVGTIVFIPLALSEKSSWQMPTFISFLMLLYLGTFCSVIAFLLYNYGLRQLSSSTAVTLMNLVPVFGVLFSVLLLHENVQANQLVGGVIVVTGVLLSVSKSNRPLKVKEVIKNDI